MIAGWISLAGWSVMVIALIVIFVLGHAAVTAIPRPDDLRPDLEPTRILWAAVMLAVGMVGFLVGVIAGIVWIVQAFTGGA